MNESETGTVRRQLDKILASEGFVNADRLCRFLRFAVEAKLSGDDDRIKEYVLGREVFDRKDDYDPRTDPIVRVEARRLRVKLEEYYGGVGRMDPIRFEFPKGSYVPVIRSGVEDRSNHEAVSPKRFRFWSAAGAILLLLAGVVSTYRFARPLRGEMIAVVPARWFSREIANVNNLDDSLAEMIAAELANRRLARVIAWPSLLRYRADRKEIRQMAEEVGAAKALIVYVRDQGGGTRVTLFFIDPISGQKMWVADYFRTVIAPLEVQRELARLVVNDFETKQNKTTRQ